MVNFKFWSRREIPSEDAITGTPKELTVPQEVNLTDDGGASEIFATPLEFPEDIDTDGEIVKGATSGTQQVWVDDEGKEGEEKVTDVNHCIEEIGFGRYQWKVILVMGMMSFADSCEIWLSSVIISTARLVTKSDDLVTDFPFSAVICYVLEVNGIPFIF